MLSDAECARLETLLADCVADAVSDLPLGADIDRRARAAVSEFIALYPQRAVRDNKGGAGFNDSLWLYVLARLIAPAEIVESGVFQGHSTWLLRAACPEAAIHSYDIELDKVCYRAPGGTLEERDWSETPPPVADPASALAYFDDHVSHARRIAEAHALGYRLCLFDDNLAAHQLFATGTPPVPTVAMLLDETLAPGMEIRWLRNGRERRHVLTQDELAARDLIRRAVPVPDLWPITRRSPGSGLTIVWLKN